MLQKIIILSTLTFGIFAQSSFAQSGGGPGNSSINAEQADCKNVYRECRKDFHRDNTLLICDKGESVRQCRNRLISTTCTELESKCSGSYPSGLPFLEKDLTNGRFNGYKNCSVKASNMGDYYHVVLERRDPTFNMNEETIVYLVRWKDNYTSMLSQFQQWENEQNCVRL